MKLDKDMGETIRNLQTISRGLEAISPRHRVNGALMARVPADEYQSILTPVERQRVEDARDLLTADPGFASLVDQDMVTFAMIRPFLNLGRRGGTDDWAYREILRQIQERFTVAFQLSWPVSESAFEQFYGHVKSKLNTPEHNKVFRMPEGVNRQMNAWDYFKATSTQGATTFLILTYPETDQQPGVEQPVEMWKQWRQFIGATIPSRAAEGTLRREWGNNNTNVVHGTNGEDGPTQLSDEINWMTDQLVYTPTLPLSIDSNRLTSAQTLLTNPS